MGSLLICVERETLRERFGKRCAAMLRTRGRSQASTWAWPECIEDAGDLAFSEEDAFAAIESGVGELMDQGKRPVSLGGDHSITFPIVKAFARRHPELTIFHFDAHPDLYDEFEGNRLSHACPFARIMEAGLAKRLVQVGIRTMNRHQREQAERFGVEVVEMRCAAGL